MRLFKLGFLGWASRPRVKRLTQGLTLVVSAVAGSVCAYQAVEMLRNGKTTSFDDWLFGTSAVLAILGLAYCGRKLCLRLMHGLLSLTVRLLSFPVYFVRDQALWLYFAITGGAMIVGFYQLASATIVSDAYFFLALGATVLLALGLVFHLVRHRLAEILAVAAVLPLLAVGIYLLNPPAPQVESYNVVMDMKKTEEGKKDLATQVKLLEVSLNTSFEDQQRSRLWHLVFGEQTIDLPAKAHFHKALATLQLPNKGKEAFDECARSLMLNPGNMYSGLTLDEMALWKNDSDQARRLLEKLIRSGQDGGRGRPNQPGTPGEQGQPQPDRRDPSREPQPGSGRQPNKIL